MPSIFFDESECEAALILGVIFHTLSLPNVKDDDDMSVLTLFVDFVILEFAYFKEMKFCVVVF